VPGCSLGDPFAQQLQTHYNFGLCYTHFLNTPGL